MNSYHKYSDDFTSSIITPEPILNPSNKRYAMYPVQYKTIWANYKTQLKNHWVVDEVDMSKDIDQWNNKLADSDRHFLSHVLAFFASADGIVNMNIKTNMIDLIQIKEAECAYGKQFDMENIHGEMYSIMIDVLISDNTQKTKLFNSIATMPTIAKKAQWCDRWINSDKTFAHKLVAFAIVEGVYFSGSFASIFWLKTRPDSPMPGLRKSNRFIARDEALHVDLACQLYSLLDHRLKQDIVNDMIKDAVKIEEEFINEAIPCALLGMNASSMTEYIKYTADRLLVQLGYNKLYDAKMVFDFMNRIDMFVKANFFEERNDSYTSAAIDNPRVFKILDVF